MYISNNGIYPVFRGKIVCRKSAHQLSNSARLHRCKSHPPDAPCKQILLCRGVTERRRFIIPVHEESQFAEASGAETFAGIHRTVPHCQSESRFVELHLKATNRARGPEYLPPPCSSRTSRTMRTGSLHAMSISITIWDMAMKPSTKSMTFWLTNGTGGHFVYLSSGVPATQPGSHAKTAPCRPRPALWTQRSWTLRPPMYPLPVPYLSAGPAQYTSNGITGAYATGLTMQPNHAAYTKIESASDLLSLQSLATRAYSSTQTYRSLDSQHPDFTGFRSRPSRTFQPPHPHVYRGHR